LFAVGRIFDIAVVFDAGFGRESEWVVVSFEIEACEVGVWWRELRVLRFLEKRRL
jgi:hypothetical protein